MELRQLKHFAMLARLGNFRQAAEQLGLSQPALSLQIMNLERELGVLLLDRSTRPVRLTAAGDVLLESAQRVLEELALVRTSLAEMTGLLEGRVAMGTIKSGPTFLPALLAGFSQTYPNVTIVVREEMGAEFLKLLMSGELDICLPILQPQGTLPPAGVSSQFLFRADYCFAVPSDHALAGRSDVTLAELSKERFILPSGGSVARSQIESQMRAAGFSPHVAYETNDHLMLVALVAQGLGLGFTTEFLLHMTRPELGLLKPIDAAVAFEAVSMWSDRSERNLACTAFRKFAQSWPWLDPSEHGIHTDLLPG